MIRARVEELLTALEDPVTGQRAADLLEVIIRTLAPASASTASDSPVWRESGPDSNSLGSRNDATGGTTSAPARR